MKRKKRFVRDAAKTDARPRVEEPRANKTLPARQWAALLALVALLAAAPYANTLSNGFTLDDVLIVVENPLIRNMGNVGKIFTTNYWSKGDKTVTGIDTRLYRPLTVLTFAIDYRFWKLDAKGYHWVNLALHVATSVLFFLVALDILVSPIAAFAAASIFAVHPIHTEAVAGIVGRAEVLAALFFLAAFWFALRDRTRAGAAAFAGISALLYLLGLLSKETAVTLPALLLICDWLRGEEFLRQPGILLYRYGRFAVALLIYLALRSQAIRTGGVWVGFAGVSASERIFTASRVLMEYLGLLVFPYTLRADYWKPEAPIAHSPLEPLVMLSLLLWAVLGIVAFHSLRKARPLFFSLAWFFITILPVSNLFLAIGVIKAERILYLPSAGFCLLVGWAYAWLEKNPRKKWIPLLPLVSILALFMVRTYIRNDDWKNNFTIAAATLKVSPTSPLSNYIAASEYRKAGELDKAIPLLQEAIRQRPDYPPYRFELGLAFSQKGLPDLAIEEYRQTINLKPDYPEAHNNLGSAYFRKGLFDQAIDEYKEALRFQPANAETRTNLGSAYFRKGWLDRAIEQYEAAARLKPEDSEARNNLGGAYFNKNQIDEAIQEFTTALQINPNNAVAHNNLGTAYFRKGLLEKAAEQYKQALALKPDYPDARNNLAAVLRQKPQIERSKP